MREGLKAVGQAGKARALTAGSVVGADGRDTARAQARASRPRGRRRKRERQRGLALGRECGPHNAGRMKATQCGRMRATQCGTHANVRTDR
jgi:hypothetical protein